MRITVTLDADTERIVRRRMREEKVSFEQALNDAIREGAAGRPAAEFFNTETASMGPPEIDVDRALQITAQLDDDALMRRMRFDS